MTFWISLWTVLTTIGSLVSTFFNSNFFVGLSTILTVFGAIWIYFRQKKEEKKNIAKLLIKEIRHAEDAIDSLKNRTAGIDIPDVVILPQNSWNKYSYKFSDDFDQDQTKAIDKFYSNAERANYIVSQANKTQLLLLQTRQRSEAIQSKLIEILEKSSDNALASNLTRFTTRIITPNLGLFHYSPQGFPNELDAYLAGIEFILDSQVGLRLKQIAEDLEE